MKRSRLLFVITLGLILAVTVVLSGATPALALPPTVTVVAPNVGEQGEVLGVAIVGTDFTGATSVSFGAGITTNFFIVDSDTQITAAITIDALAAVGAKDVSVTNADGMGTLAGGFMVNQAPPVVAAVTPNYGLQGQTENVTITGIYFAGATSVSFGADIATNSFTVDNDTQITAGITIGGAAAPGPRDASVSTTEGTDSLAGGFWVLSTPTVAAVSPGQGIQAQTENVTISGSFFTGATSVDFGADVTTNSFVVTPSSGSAEVQIGTGTGTNVYPFRTYWLDIRTQSILLASEIGQPGLIQKLRLYCDQRPGQDLTNLYIRMQHTALDSFPSTSYVNGGWTTVLYATNVDVDAWTVPGWVEFDLTTPFDYDGTSNLLVDYCVETSIEHVVNGYCRYTDTATYRTIYDRQDLPGSNLLNSATGTREAWHNNVVLVMQGDTIEANITIGAGAAAGYRDVVVTTPAGTDNLTNGFAVLAIPGVTSVGPTEADQGQTTDVTITGTDFFGAAAVDFGAGITVNSFSVDNNTQITASITVSGSAALGARDVTVANAAGSDTLVAAFTVDQAPPAITGVNPGQGAQGQTVDVTITGNYFTGAAAVDFGAGITTNSFTVDSDTQITANITIDGAATPGYRDVTVTTPEGADTEANGFTVVGVPTLSSVSPGQAVQGETASVTITGTNLFGVTTVGFGAGVTVNSFTVDNATQITASITVAGAAAVGTRDVTVTNGAGTATLTAGFTVNQAPPTITLANPSQGVQTQTLDVFVVGTYFTGATAVSFGADIATNSFTVDSATQITANITIGGSAAAGLRDFSVTTPGGTATSINGFTVLTLPTITSASPNVADQGETTNVTIAGTNLSGVTAVGFGAGIAVNSFTVDSDSQITAGITIDEWAAVGARDVSVAKAGVAVTLASGFTVDQAPPVVGSAAPDQGIQGQTENVTITGTHLEGATAVGFGPGITVNSFAVTAASTPEVQVGTGTATQTFPFHTWYDDTRTQSILLSGEIGQPGQIQKLRLYCSTRPGQNLTHFYIRMQHTAMSSFSSTGFVNSGWTTALHATGVNVSSWSVPGWVEFELATPFDYNGVDNLLIDYCVDNSYYTSNGECRSTTATNRTLYYYADLGSTDLLNRATGNLASWYNNVVLVMYADTIEANITVSGAATPGYRDVSVTTPEGTDTAVNGFVVLGIPGISSLSPSEATQGQSANVIITGANLFGATAVDFGGGITVNSFSVDSGTQITASITIGSSATPGVRDVSVTNAAGTATLAGGFTVNQAPPTLASVNPDQGVQGQTLDVTLTGTSFTGATSVSFGADITVNSYTVDGNTQVTASITIGGSAAPGLRDVSLTTPGGTDTLPNGFTVLGIPAITLANPNQGAQGQTLGVTVSGSNLTGATSVSFGADVTTNSFTVDSSTQITANISIGAGATPGMRDVSVTAPGGTATLTNGFIVVALPTLVSVLPAEADQGQTLSVTLTGTDLLGVTTVGFGAGITVNSFTVDNSTQITANISIGAAAALGARDVSVTNAAGTATLTSGFTVDQAPPAIASLVPTQGLQGQTGDVTITGSYFTGATAVGFGDNITVNSFTVDSDSQITANISIDAAAPAGYRDVSVTTGEGTDTEANGFLVVALPALSSVNPSEGDQGQTLSVTITGTDLFGVTTVDLGAGIAVNSFTVDNATQITASISIDGSAVVGARDVSVTNAAGTATLTSGFTVNQAPPAIASVSPAQGIAGQTDNVTITGSYFTGATAVSFGDNVTINSFTVDNDTQITVGITIDPAAAAGYRDVSVTTAAGTDTEANGYLVVGIPAVVSVSPGQAVQGQTIGVTITGTGFLGATNVGFGLGITVNSFTVDNATQITASITISGSATAGARDVSVTNAAGTATLSGGFRVNQAPPTISSVSPKQGLQGQTLSVTVWGGYFTGASAVSFGPDTVVNSYMVNNSGQITASITIGGSAAPGSRSVTVTTAAGTATLPNGFTVVGLPAVISISPGQAAQGETVSVTITGTSFLGATAVSFGPGITVNSFTVDSDTQITASITVSGSAAAGAIEVSVTTPAGAGSLADGFTVAVPSPDTGAVTPESGAQGASFEVVITGAGFTGATDVSFGEGVTVESFTVDSPTQITARVRVAPNAAPGMRDVSVVTPDGTVTLSDVFEVQTEAGSGGGGVPVFVWVLIGLIAAAGILLLGFLIKRRKKQEVAG